MTNGLSERGRMRYAEQGQRLRAARETTGISQENWAPRVGCTRFHVMNLEKGKHKPGAAILAARSELTGVPVDDFGYDQGDPDDDEESHLTLVADLMAVLSNRERIVAADRLIQSVTADGAVSGLLAAASGSLGLAVRRQLDEDLLVAFSREVAS